MSEMIVVHCDSRAGLRHNYADAVGWEVDDRGGLRVLAGGAKALAAFPPGVWLHVERVELAAKSDTEGVSS